MKPVNGSAFQYGFSNNGTTDYGYAKTDTGWGVASEMGHLFYVTLGNKGYCTPDDASPGSCVEQPGRGLTNIGNFQNMQPWDYWSGLEYAPGPGSVWYFDTGGGAQSVVGVGNSCLALAVRPGDVLTAVPEPQTYVLLMLGLTGLALARRRRR